MKTFLAPFAAVVLLAANPASAQFNIGPLTSFGGNGDGWWAVGEAGSTGGLTTGGTERGLAFGNGHLLLSAGAGGSPNVRILDPLTGVETGTLNMSGVTLGSANRALNGIRVGSDGAIYGANLTLNVTTAPFVVYRWATEASTPTVVFSGAPLAGARLGDSFDLIGGGANTRIVAGYATTPSVTGNNGYALIDPTASTATHVAFGGTPPAAGDFRLGITFGANDTIVYGDQGNIAADTRYTSYSGSTGTLLGTLSLTAAAERHMDYAIINGLPVLATIETGSGGTTSTVRVYDLSNPLVPALLGSAKNQTGTVTANGNGTGGLVWGTITPNGDGTSSAHLYAMNSNNGLQAFIVTVPEPGMWTLTALGIGAFLLVRRLRR